MAAPSAATRPDANRVLGQEEAMAKALVELMDTEGTKVKTMSDLDESEIGVLTLLNIMGDHLKIQVLSDFVTNYSQFKVSRARLGRREIINSITFGAIGGDDRRKTKSIKDLFGGMK
jgi:hypothetical protein